MKPPITSTLAMLLMFNYGAGSAVAETMAAGHRATPMTFTDIDGRSANTNDYSDRVQVWTFGDYRSSGRLMEWMETAGLQAMSKHPNLRFSFLNFADVSKVPALFRPMSIEIMRHMNESAKEDLEEAYAKQGVELTPDRAKFHLTADWEGDFLKLFGIAHAKQYHCWVVHDGRVIAHLVEGSPDITSRFSAAIASIEQDRALNSH